MRPGPNSKSGDHNRVLVYLLRNPATAIPAHLNGKRIKYAKKVGQQPIDDWRKTRDFRLVKDFFPEYEAQLKEWMSMSNYRMGMILSLEDLMDYRRGPLAIKQLAAIMRDAGFDAAPDEDADCLWYQAVGGGNKDALIDYHQNKFGYEYYEEYLPGYTPQQQTYLLEQLDRMIAEYSKSGNGNDPSGLVRVLDEYKTYVQDELILDEPWVNQTASIL